MKFFVRISYFPVLLLSLSLLLIVTMGMSPVFAESEISGIVYSPIKKNAIFEDVVKDDLHIISAFTQNIRLYTIDDNTQKILENAKINNLKVTLGIDLANSDNDGKIQSDLQMAVKFAQDYPGIVDSVVVGNDAIAQQQVTINQLEQYLKLFHDNDILVSSANSPYIWQENPGLTENVDYILLYSFDFWQGLDARHAAQNTITQYDKLQTLYPDKPIIIETGWPSDGTSISDAIPTEKEQSEYLKSFVDLSNQNSIRYYVFEYANESWKPAKNNNTVENNWGLLYEKERVVKPHLTSLFEFESVKYTTTVESNGQTNYKPIKSNTEGNKILKVVIPQDITTISYQISDQSESIQTNGKQTVLFIQTAPNQDITITTDRHSDNLEFSLIPQAFASCDVDAVCYEINHNDDTSISIVLLFVVGFVFSIVYKTIKLRRTPKRFGEPFVERAPMLRVVV